MSDATMIMHAGLGEGDKTMNRRIKTTLIEDKVVQKKFRYRANFGF